MMTLPLPIAAIPDFSRTITPPSQVNFKWRNQRQIRKNRRRAAAAGFKNAFKKK